MFVAFIGWMFALFYFVVVIALLFPIRMTERIGLFDALGRGRYLVRGNYGSSFAVLFVAGILMTILSLFFNIPGYVLTFMGGWHAVSQETSQWLSYFLTGASMLGSLGSAVLYAIPVSAVTLQYFSLVEKKEKAGLLRRIEGLTDDAA